MRIIQVNYVYDDGVTDPDLWLERVPTLTGWSEALLAAGASAVGVAQRFGRDAEVIRGGIRYVFRTDGGPGVPRAWRWTRSRALHQAVREGAPDVVHVNGLAFRDRTAALRRELPASSALVLQDHGDLPRRRMWPFRRRGFVADALFFTSEAQAQPWREAGSIAREETVVAIPESGATMTPMAREGARRLTRIDGDPAVLWVGRLNRNKDPLTVVDGFARAAARLPRASLTMVFAAGELRTAVAARLAEQPALAGRVRLVGRVPHERIAAFYSAADLFVLGSHHEGSGYALLEAMACGVLPVVTDIPSFRALTGGAGVLWRTGDAAACGDAIVDAARRATSGSREEIIARFEEHLSWPAVARQAMHAYAEALVGRSRRHY
ncbi:MAG TPA: glycosyltransferase family 4 protein [Vicinamibacterales bacterium]|nr:glycosyltransferase family 4 protein [Vicinamibacterales bacterium]